MKFIIGGRFYYPSNLIFTKKYQIFPSENVKVINELREYELDFHYVRFEDFQAKNEYRKQSKSLLIIQ